jgi:hypothetical protein
MSQNIDLQAGIVLFLMCLVAGSISAFAAHQMIPPVLDWYRARDYAPVQARVQIPKNTNPEIEKRKSLDSISQATKIFLFLNSNTASTA